MAMSKKDAVELVCELKGLMPMVSDYQADRVMDALMGRDDVVACLNAIRSYATSYDQFGLAGFIDHLPPRPGDSAASWDRLAYERNREERERIDAQQRADEAICRNIPRDEFNRIAREQVMLFDADVQTLYPERRDLMASGYIRSLVAAYARAHGMVRNRVMEVA